ncbi:MAG: hypothetical protein IKP81_04030 [Paludibacteraceae bacterium]|nr:hypothetical protein [Paludibacteraceae bacterium]
MKKIVIILILFGFLILYLIIDLNFIVKEYVYSVPNTKMSVKVIRNPSKNLALVYFDDNDFIKIKTTKCIDIGTTYYIDTLEKRIICLEFFDKIKEIHSNRWRIEKFEWRKTMKSYNTDKIRSTIIDELNGDYFCIYASEHVLYWAYYDNKKEDTFELELEGKRSKGY